MAAKWALEASWRPLGGLLEPLKRLGRPRGGFQGLMGRSWTPLGALLGPKKVVLNGSWPLQEEFQDRFQPSWGPKGSRKGGQEGPKSSPRGDSSSKRDFFKKYCFAMISLLKLSWGLLESLGGPLVLSWRNLGPKSQRNIKDVFPCFSSTLLLASFWTPKSHIFSFQEKLTHFKSLNEHLQAPRGLP